MDTNAEILIELAQLRGLSTALVVVIGFDFHLHPLWMQLLRLFHFQATYYMILHHIEKEKDKSTC